MSTYLMPKAFCKATNQTVKSQNLSRRFAFHERVEAMKEAEYLASQMNKKTGDHWSAKVESYQLINQTNKL
jgi:hypothetical protein